MLWFPKARRVLTSGPLQDIKVSSFSCSRTSQRVPRARRVLTSNPLQDIKVTSVSCHFTSPHFPRTRRVLASKPLQKIKVTSLSCSRTSRFIELATLAPQPFQHINVTSGSSTCSCYHSTILALDIQRDSLAPQPPPSCCPGKRRGAAGQRRTKNWRVLSPTYIPLLPQPCGTTETPTGTSEE